MNGHIFSKTVVVIGFLLIVFLVIFYFFVTVIGGVKISIPRFDNFSKNLYTLEYSEGTCTANSQCKWAGDGCGGGHGLCTNTPDKYKNALSTCDVNEKFPANQGYKCGCVVSIKKCGWIK